MTIVKRDKKFCVVSEHGGKNLGCSPSHGGAVKRLGQVEYFKHAHKSLTEGAIIKSMDEGSMIVSDAELLPWMMENKSLLKSLGADMDDPETKSFFSHHDPGSPDDQHIDTERLRYLLFDILAGAPIPDWHLVTFEDAGVISNDDGVVITDSCGHVHELTVIMTNAGTTVTQAEQQSVAAGGGFDPEAELAGDLINYLDGKDLERLIAIRAVPSNSFEDGAEFVFDDGTVVDVLIRGSQQQAHDDNEVALADSMVPPAPIVSMQMMSEAKSAAASYQCFSNMLSEYGGSETGELMAKGKTLFDNGSYEQAAALFEKARNTLDAAHYPGQTYAACLEDWAGYADDLAHQPPTAVSAKSGTSEGAKKGWEARKVSGQNHLAAAVDIMGKMPQFAKHTQSMRDAVNANDDLPKAQNHLGRAMVGLFADSLNYKEANGRSMYDDNPGLLDAAHHISAAYHDYDKAADDKFWSTRRDKSGTSEGAKKGWRDRLGKKVKEVKESIGDELENEGLIPRKRKDVSIAGNAAIIADALNAAHPHDV